VEAWKARAQEQRLMAASLSTNVGREA